MDSINSQIGDKISVYRKSKGYTQADMAEKLDISRTAYNQLETGHTSISVERLFEVARVLGVSIVSLLPGEGEKIDMGSQRDFSEEEVQSVLRTLEDIKNKY